MDERNRIDGTNGGTLWLPPAETIPQILKEHFREVQNQYNQKIQYDIEQQLLAAGGSNMGSIFDSVPAYEQEVLAGDHRADYQATAKRLVIQTVDDMFEDGKLPAYEVYVVWFCKTLKNWKALLGTTLADGYYFEVTFNGEADETYIDVYKKQENIVVYNKVADREDNG